MNEDNDFLINESECTMSIYTRKLEYCKLQQMANTILQLITQKLIAWDASNVLYVCIIQYYVFL